MARGMNAPIYTCKQGPSKVAPTCYNPDTHNILKLGLQSGFSPVFRKFRKFRPVISFQSHLKGIKVRGWTDIKSIVRFSQSHCFDSSGIEALLPCHIYRCK